MSEKLSRDVIARAGLRLLEVAGIEGLTTRALARDLSVKSPTLYWHVKSKSEIIRSMAVVMADDAAASLTAADRRGSWQQCLSAWAHALRREMTSHRDGARVFAGSFSADASSFDVTETILQAMLDAGIELDVAAQCVVVMRHFVVGFCVEEQALHDLHNGDDPGWLATLRSEASRLPVTARALPTMFDSDDQSRFELGMQLMLSGIESMNVETARVRWKSVPEE